MKKRNTLRYWEVALLLSLVVTLVWGAWSLQQRQALGEKMIRLHVIANSDSQQDQTLKLEVRDAVLAKATSILESAPDRAVAAQMLRAELPDMERQAEAVLQAEGCNFSVKAQLEETEFPLRQYEGFALPAGNYLALRILIGEAQGQNWWCVVFPPLCTAAATDMERVAIAAGMGEEDVSLLQGEETGYVLKFRSLELWESLRQWLRKN